MSTLMIIYQVHMILTIFSLIILKVEITRHIIDSEETSFRKFLFDDKLISLILYSFVPFLNVVIIIGLWPEGLGKRTSILKIFFTPCSYVLRQNEKVFFDNKDLILEKHLVYNMTF